MERCVDAQCGGVDRAIYGPESAPFPEAKIVVRMPLRKPANPDGEQLATRRVLLGIATAMAGNTQQTAALHDAVAELRREVSETPAAAPRALLAEMFATVRETSREAGRARPNSSPAATMRSSSSPQTLPHARPKQCWRKRLQVPDGAVLDRPPWVAGELTVAQRAARERSCPPSPNGTACQMTTRRSCSRRPRPRSRRRAQATVTP